MCPRENGDTADENDLDLDRVFRRQRRSLWTLCYRLTGSGAGADDMVQEAFVQVIERPPTNLGRGYEPWLVRAATRLSLAELRERHAQEYAGAWLPSPVDTQSGVGFLPGVDVDAPPKPISGARYDLVESTSFPFLLALEPLPPMERGVLVLRDVLAYGLESTSEALDENETTVDRWHEQARQAMTPYDEGSAPPDDERHAKTRRTLEHLLDGLARSDAKAVETLLAENARLTTDSGGSYEARAFPVDGRGRVAEALLADAAKRREAQEHSEIREINGLPAALLQVQAPKETQAPRTVLRFDLDHRGAIAQVHSIIAPSKLASIRFERDL